MDPQRAVSQADREPLREQLWWALRRLNAITEQLEALDFASTPAHVLNGLKREELVALNSTLLHELYFASLGGDGQPTKGMSEALARDFGSLDRWRAEFRAMGYALGGGSGWVVPLVARRGPTYSKAGICSAGAGSSRPTGRAHGRDSPGWH